MKKIHFVYGIATLIVIAILSVVISPANETHRTQVPVQQETVETPTATEKNAYKATTVTGKKKACGCCAERKARARELLLKARQRKNATRQAEPTVSASQ